MFLAHDHPLLLLRLSPLTLEVKYGLECPLGQVILGMPRATVIKITVVNRSYVLGNFFQSQIYHLIVILQILIQIVDFQVYFIDHVLHLFFLLLFLLLGHLYWCLLLGRGRAISFLHFQLHLVLW